MKQLFEFPSDELLVEDTVFITIVQELHATTLTSDKDRIQFENLISEAKSRISNSDLTEKDDLLEQLDIVVRNQGSLTKFIGALVLYITPTDFYFYHLGISVTDRVYIGRSPYILPVAANAQYTLDYHLLVLNRESIRLFEGHGTKLFEQDLSEYEDAPVDLETALGTEKEGGNLNFGTYSSGAAQAGTSQFFHGHQETSQEKDIDRDRYFRLVDSFIYDHFSNESKYPLIIYSVEENQSVFKDISNNKFLMDTAITGSAAGLNTQDIQTRVSELITKLNDSEREELLNRLEETTPENRIENIPDDLTSASLQGRIDNLFLQKDFEILGTITDEGRYDSDDEKNNFIHVLVRNVLNSKGNVYIFNEEDMPDGIPIAATLRY